MSDALKFLIVIKRSFSYFLPMARPINADATATRNRILERASALFAERGAGQTSIRSIASEANVSLAMVHHYFGSKGELYTACVESMYLELAGLRDSLLAELQDSTHTTQSEFLEHVVRSGWRFVCSHRSAMRLVMRDVIDQGEVPEERMRSFLVPFLDSAGALFAADSAERQTYVRTALQGMVFMFVRYSLSNPEEIRLIVAADDYETAARLLEENLVNIAKSLLIEKA